MYLLAALLAIQVYSRLMLLFKHNYSTPTDVLLNMPNVYIAEHNISLNDRVSQSTIIISIFSSKQYRVMHKILIILIS